MLFLKNLKTILPYSILFLMASLVCIRILTMHSCYEEGKRQLQGTLWSYQINGNQLKAKVYAEEMVLISYYFETEEEILAFLQQFHLGDQIIVEGTLKVPSSNRNFHLFNYQKYLKSQKIFWIVSAVGIEKKASGNFLWKGKERIIEQFDAKENAMYLKYLLLGDSSEIASTFKEEASVLGISHLFAVSGMHIHLLVGMLLWLLKKMTKKSWIHLGVLLVFLSFYNFLTDFTPSLLRASLFFLFLFLKRMLKIPVSSFYLLMFVFLGMLIYNPYYGNHLGFLFSFIISFSLILFNQKQTSYWKQLFQTSWIAFWMGVPILIRHFFQVNFLTPIWNLFFVPLVSLFLFPLCVFSFVLPFGDSILSIVFAILNWCMAFGNQFTFLKFSFSFISFPVFLGYYLLIVYALHSYLHKNWKPFVSLIVVLFFHYHITNFNPHSTLTMIDVGQGDSILITLPYGKGNILIDTGGVAEYGEEWKQKKSTYSIGKSILIPYLYSRGIHKLDYLILTHGDLDHMKEASTLLADFSVDHIVMNSGKCNALEEELMQQAHSKFIPVTFLSKGKIEIGNQSFYFLNDKNSKNENEDSLIVYTKLGQLNILLMGDAGEETEKKLLEQYHIPQIDLLKVGHHGSKGSTSFHFLKQIQPRYALVSAGVNNRFGHPHQEVLNRLEEVGSYVYATNQYGMITFTFRREIEIQTRYLAR